eukprot:Amastigsp_a340897_346.p2 type:complete len:105 gc:universal Amastigsp_a340897_346:336-22(-)
MRTRSLARSCASVPQLCDATEAEQGEPQLQQAKERRMRKRAAALTDRAMPITAPLLPTHYPSHRTYTCAPEGVVPARAGPTARIRHAFHSWARAPACDSQAQRQ